VRYFLRRRQPPVSRILLVESGSRHLIERVLPGLRRTTAMGSRSIWSPVTPARPRASSAVHRVTDHRGPDGRRKLYRALAANRYSIMGVVCSAEPIMTKWKWALAARLPAKVFVINENGDYFWLDRGHWRAILHFALFRAGLTGSGAARTLGACSYFRSLCRICYSMHRPFIFAAHGAKVTMKAIQVKETGGPEKMELVDLPQPAAGPGQALVKIAASGVNFIDVYFRTGLYKAELPATLGSEAAGTVESVGAGVTEVAPGDRVAYAMARGSYAEYAVVPAAQLVKIPAGHRFSNGRRGHAARHDRALSDAFHFRAEAGDTCLVHAAAGGAGLLLVQMAHASARASSARSPPKPRRSLPNRPAPMKSSFIRRRISRPKCGVSPADEASTWCTIRWAPPHLPRA
jgi:hypothetical protein